MIRIPEHILHSPDAALAREWLVTNGIGGYASSTVLGTNTRRYHGLLVASFPPPLERQVTLSRADEELSIGAETYSLSTNEYHDGTIDPQGYALLKSFHLELGIPTFEYEVAGVRLIKRVWMEQGLDTVYIAYRIEDDGDRRILLRVRPFCAFRGYHHEGQRRGQEEFSVLAQDGGVTIEAEHAPYSLRLLASSQGSCSLEGDWYYGFLYRAERERGFDCLEDLYTPGVFTIPLLPGEWTGIVATCERAEPDTNITGALAREVERRRRIVGDEQSALRSQLLLAADRFVVSRPADVHEGNGNRKRLSILAGYHWFTDWGRDTMISLPGLLLSTGRFPEAREILLRYIEWAEGGMIPNRFTDEGSAEYNTADATLWYFHALDSYVRESGDREIIERLFPRLAEIIDWHLRGTRFGIHADPSDGLLFAGHEGSQVTWMDARVNGLPVTPRIGKPVEINALWYNALCLMGDWAREVGSPANAYEQAARRCRTSFRRRFWYRKGSYLYDVIDGPAGDDPCLRPNQIIAVSLPHSPLGTARRKAVVDVVERELLTPHGLRTLSPDDPKYIGEYRGGFMERDGAYHQGTVWPWLLGPFADAHRRVYRDSERVSLLLRPFYRHVCEAGIGGISEVFDGDPPHSPGGCICQAWSIAEILRISGG